ncbi:fungal specific transcription factor domain-containing protein [Colletotrichum karsti]|uniref:Fungal specific transcription factor domain-containing protein n=1 Tax=Colletotrichum karsti TaxID=1095194 RepID=A0A9P6IE32_9PEZI|nr:fungal specific transcription factor domain-containing protein [Colletotrichum karsti]KAF9880181.1 fungal specific transcription factor domain-containing protein [Colletotrichum karsti]
MSANASEGRISMTVQSIMADIPDPPTSTSTPTTTTPAAAITAPAGAPSDDRTRAASISTAPTPSSNVSQPSPSSVSLPPIEAPSRRKRPLPGSRADDGPSPTQPTDPSRRKRPLPEGRPDDGPQESQAMEASRKKRSLPEGRPSSGPSPDPSESSRRTLPERPSSRHYLREESESGPAQSPVQPTATAAAAATAAANRRRSHKVSRACDYCKAKKLKCSGTIPCNVCTKKRLACIYDASYRRGRPPTPPPAPSAGVETATTEARLTRAIPQAQPSASAAPTLEFAARPLTLETSPPARFEESVQPVSRASPEVDVAEIEGQYFDTTSSLNFLHRAWKRLSSQRLVGGVVPHVASVNELNQSMTRAGDKPFASATHESHPLPGRAAGLEMMHFYFDVCVVTYRCLHQGYVVEWFNTLLTNALDNEPLHREIGHAKASIVLTILAIVTLRKIKVNGTAPSPDEASELRRSDSYFCRATGLTDQETGLPKLESAQARLLQVLYLLQTSRMNQAWYVFGSILPIVSALGLHRKSSRKRANNGQGPQFDYIVSQCRKRTFWVAYTIDKYLSVVFGRPRMYHDEDIDQDFPDCVNDEDMTPQGRSSDEPEMDCHVESLIFHAKLAQLIDGISREVYSIKHVPKDERLLAAHRYGRALHAWRESLPHHLGTVRPMSLIPSFRRQNTALKLAYCHAIMHANRPFLLGTSTSRRETQATALDDSVEECINAARTALETVDGMASDGTLFHAFWWTPYVTFCALAVVYVWKIQRGEDDGDKSLFELADRCQNHLARATTSDSPSRRYSVILEELREEAKGPEARRRLAEQGAASEQLESGRAMDPMQVDEPSASGVAPSTEISDVFQAQGFEGMTNLLAGWETTDWLDLDSSVYRYLQTF